MITLVAARPRLVLLTKAVVSRSDEPKGDWEIT